MGKEYSRDLVDRLAVVRAGLKRLKDEEEQLKTELSGLNTKFVDGHDFVVIVRDLERKSLDLDRVKDEMGPLWMEDHTVTTYFQRFDVESKDSKL